MKKLIKRLEIIKSGIELEDDDIIRHQLPYLKSETQDPVLVFIVMAIEQGKFTQALDAIATWLGSKQGVIQWQDIELAACKLELKALEEQLSELIDKRNERIQLLDDFNDLYLVRLGPLMKQSLTCVGNWQKALYVKPKQKPGAENATIAIANNIFLKR